MNDLSLFGDKRMTVKEVAEALGTAESTIRNKAAELFPDLVKNGVATLLDEKQVFELKKNLVPRDLTLKSKLDSAETSLDIEEMTLRVIAYHKAEADRLRAELAIAIPKIESFDALQRSERTMSITEAAKHFGLHPKTEVFPYLRAMGYLTLADLPSQAALDSGYLAQIQARGKDGEFRPQAVVLASQLETWRTRVTPQIKAWEAKE